MLSSLSGGSSDQKEVIMFSVPSWQVDYQRECFQMFTIVFNAGIKTSASFVLLLSNIFACFV
jgi:hypothetical protein